MSDRDILRKEIIDFFCDRADLYGDSASRRGLLARANLGEMTKHVSADQPASVFFPLLVERLWRALPRPSAVVDLLLAARQDVGYQDVHLLDQLIEWSKRAFHPPQPPPVKPGVSSGATEGGAAATPGASRDQVADSQQPVAAPPPEQQSVDEGRVESAKGPIEIFLRYIHSTMPFAYLLLVVAIVKAAGEFAKLELWTMGTAKLVVAALCFVIGVSLLVLGLSDLRQEGGKLSGPRVGKWVATLGLTLLCTGVPLWTWYTDVPLALIWPATTPTATTTPPPMLPVMPTSATVPTATAPPTAMDTVRLTNLSTHTVTHTAVPSKTATPTDVVVTPVTLTSTPGPVPTDTSTPTSVPSNALAQVPRRLEGAWVDSIVVVEEPSSDTAVRRLQSGDLDIYAYTISNPEVYRRVAASSALDYDRSFGSYNELTFNPSGPVFESTGKLNPFAVARVREAMNWLIDREYIVQEIMGGMGEPRWLPFNNASNDYAKLADVARRLEFQYAYDKDKARTVIGEEMVKLSAQLVGDKWQYKGQRVEIILLIRTEDERRDIGDYVANQLEDIGFTVTRDYKAAADASPIWLRGNPADGKFHIYTGGWITTVVPRDLGDNFAFFYTDMGLPFPLWQNYTNTSRFYDLAQRLDGREFSTLAERRDMMAEALELSLKDSGRIWLADRASITPRRAEVQVSADLYGGVAGSWLWAFTLQREGEAGGEMTIGMPSILTEPWNPIAGSNWIYDMMLIRGTGEMAHMPDPYTGLWWPQRMERGEVFIKKGLPVGKTLDWVDLKFVPEIVVPSDAWADWDAKGQRFITVGEKHRRSITALRKSIVYYPADLYDKVMWHDGSRFSVADVVMGMILTFDRAKEDSPVFDQAVVATFDSFMSAFKGVRIVSTNPLVIETYSDFYNLDAELNITTWWPYYAQGQGAWHQLTLGLMAEQKKRAAFSAAKADALRVEWLSYIAGPTLSILDAQLQQAITESYIPYRATLRDYLTAAQAKERYENLKDWSDQTGHYWVGTGPLYIEQVFPVAKTVSLKRNPSFPDPSDKWMRFAEPMLAKVFVDGPSRVTVGAQAIFNVEVTFDNKPYLTGDIDQVRYLVFDATGELALVGNAKAVSDGLWQIVLSADDTRRLQAGSNRIETVVVSNRVAVPSSDALIFSTVQ